MVKIQIGDRFRLTTTELEQIWICTDVGTRVIVGIKDIPDWTNGPPYALAEQVFDEHDQEVIEVVR